MVIGVGTEKVLAAGFTGLNTRSGDLLTVTFKCAKPRVAPAAIDSVGGIHTRRVAELMHIVLHSDHILEIHDSRVRVF